MLVATKQTGQGLLEYALILVLVAIVVILALTLLGETLTEWFTRVSEAIPQ